jgi:hypothetical protein
MRLGNHAAQKAELSSLDAGSSTEPTGLLNTTVDGRVSGLCDVAASISLAWQVRTVFLVVGADEFQNIAIGN